MQQTPRQRGIVRSATASSSPNNFHHSTSAAVNRKASLFALTGTGPSTPSAAKMSDPPGFIIGDSVNVPGEMHGTVKFVGSIRGKQGNFVGVELSREFAARGKNNGDVEGTSYFKTSIPGSGIFLPAHRAERRNSPEMDFDDYPGSPGTPSYASYRGQPDFTPPTPSLPKFSQSMGPGARPPSPHLRPKSRPSLPRPESPFRKTPALPPTPARNFSMSQRPGAATPRFAPSPAPSRSATPKAGATARTPAPSRPYSRSGSRLSNRHDMIPEKSSAGGAQSGGMAGFPHPRRSPSRQITTINAGQEEEIRRLTAQLEEKDRQLKEQSESLAEMESSLKEIQLLMPPDEQGSDAQDVADLRQALHDKDDRIEFLVADFDAHRADFRSTIDTLELASAETERVYEAKVGDLLAEIQDIRDSGGNDREDMEIVAEQLRNLEELVAELEEGLEDARRGEAEARGEVEFLRGEVERGRSELRREREKAAKALQGAKEAEGMQTRDKDVEMKDDEIRGLKAIIHSLSSGPETASPASRGNHTPSRSPDPEELERTQEIVQQLEREKSELQGLVERKAFREEELERAIDQLRRAAQEERDSIINERTTSPLSVRRPTTLSPENRRSSHGNRRPSPSQAQSQNGNKLWCDACETEGHDIVTCDDLSAHQPKSSVHELSASVNDEHEDVSHRLQNMGVSSQNGDHEDDLSHHDYSGNNGHAEESKKEANTHKEDNDADKWCALCEKDGHLAFDCPEDL